MDLHVFGPLSVRKNDLTSLELSKFEEQFAQLQQGSEISRDSASSSTVNEESFDS
jgi:hypothetical protein